MEPPLTTAAEAREHPVRWCAHVPARNGSWNWLRTSLIVSLRLAIAVFALLSRVSIIDMIKV